jgi:uncharacterized membrane protein
MRSTLWRAAYAVNRRSRKLADVPVEERGVRASERCSLHPGTTSVARCDSCGRALCLPCAVPVRGRTYGAECLADALGPEAAGATSGAAAPARAMPPAGLGFALALLGVALPWSRFGMGSGPLGALGRQPRWSWVVAGAAAAGLVWSLLERWLESGRATTVVTIVFAALVVLGSALSIGRPPPFTRTWIGPWVSAAGGCVALIVGLLPQISGRRGPSEGSPERS